MKMIWDVIREYEKVGYLVNEEYELFIEDSKFSFRNMTNGKRYSIEYNLKDNFDDREYTQEEIDDMKLCVKYAKKYGLLI